MAEPKIVKTTLSTRKREDRRPNEEIRREIEASGMKFWELAQTLGISESSLYRILRTPLTPEQVKEIRQKLGVKVKR